MRKVTGRRAKKRRLVEAVNPDVKAEFFEISMGLS